MANATTTGGFSGGVGGAATGAKVGGAPGAVAGGVLGLGSGLLSGYYMDAGNRQRQGAIDSAAGADQADMASMNGQYSGFDQWGQGRYNQQMAMQNQALQAYRSGQMSGPQAQAFLAQHQQQALQGMQAPTQVAPGANGAIARRYQQQAQQRGAAAVAPAQLQAAQAHMQAQQAGTGRVYQQAGWQNQAYGQNTDTQSQLERAGIMGWSREAANDSADRWRAANQAGSGNFAKGSMVQGLTNAAMGMAGGFG